MDILNNLISNALYPQDSAKAISVGLAVTILGNFRYTLPELNLLNYEFSKYTYMQEEVINGYVKTQGSIKISAYRELDNGLNTYALNVVSNELIIKLFESYTNQGGLFSLITPVGIIANLILEKLDISFQNANPIFNFTFKKLNVSSGSANKMSNRATLCI